MADDDQMINILRSSALTFPAWLPDTTCLESGEKRTVHASTGPFSIVATFTGDIDNVDGKEIKIKYNKCPSSGTGCFENIVHLLSSFSVP